MESEKPKEQPRRGVVPAVLVTLALVTGLCLLLYPSVSEYVHSLNFKKEIDSYQSNIGTLDDPLRREMLGAAQNWNAGLLRGGTVIGALASEERRIYNGLLDPSGIGMMGYVEIARLHIYLPVYHGTDENVLHSGVGHVEGSSLPVGGAGTHCILSGHTGLPSAKLFSNIDQMKKGDTFALHVLGETLTYRVESTVVLTPEEAGQQRIEPGKDLCTLMTCTPYGVNTHRLLVRGVRVPTPQNAAGEADEIRIPMPVTLKITLCVLPVALAAAVVLVVIRNRRVRP